MHHMIQGDTQYLAMSVRDIVTRALRKWEGGRDLLVSRAA